MAWRLADAIDTLKDELNAAWPGRDKSSDGGIGDQRHAAQGSSSDHNPWVIDSDGRGVVRAYDIDVDLDGTNDGNGGQALDDLREHLRQLGESGDPRLQDHGYIISNGQIASETGGWAWRPHTTDPHFDHIHLSVARNEAGYDDAQPWGVAALLAPVPAPISQLEDIVKFHYAQHTGHPDVFLVNLATAPKKVTLFADADYWAAQEGHTIGGGSDTLGADGNGDIRPGLLLDDKGAALFGIV